MSGNQNDKVNLAEKLQQFTERWSPRIVGEFNGQLAKLEGEFFIVPRGVEHKPVTEAETHVLFLEPTINPQHWQRSE